MVTLLITYSSIQQLNILTRSTKYVEELIDKLKGKYNLVHRYMAVPNLTTRGPRCALTVQQIAYDYETVSLRISTVTAP